MEVYSWIRRTISRPKNVDTNSSSPNSKDKKKLLIEDEIEFYGITEKLIEFINTFTLDTFKSFPLLEESEANCGEEGKERNVRIDLSEWQEQHATIALSRSKHKFDKKPTISDLPNKCYNVSNTVLSHIRFKLCPGFLKERQFWRIYFALVKSYVAEYQLRAIQIDKLRQMKVENDAAQSNSAYEVEMSETKPAQSLKDGSG